MLPTTTARVRLHTPASVNARIRRETEQRLLYYTQHPEDIDARLAALDREWDVDRTLEAKLAGLALVGFVLGTFRRRGWFALTGIASTFLLVQALQGWCPPLPILRQLGVRTASEIEFERAALRALRGDFEALGKGASDRSEGVRKLVADSTNGDGR